MTRSVFNPNMNFQDFDKLKTSLRYWLMGRDYTQAIKAMEFAMGYHTGTRKNGDPEFIHQLSQVQYARTLEKQLIDPEGTFVTLFLHDVMEDYGVKFHDIEGMFGGEVAQSVFLMTNCESDGTKKNTDMYYGLMADDPRASFGKASDRLHNLSTMIGVFGSEKQMSYCEQSNNLIIPMLKKARTVFPEQEAAYHNVKHILEIQMELIRAINVPLKQH